MTTAPARFVGMLFLMDRKIEMKVKKLLQFFRRFIRAREAVSALEYAILVGVVVAAVGAALVTFSGNIETAMNTVGTAVKGVKAPVIPDFSK